MKPSLLGLSPKKIWRVLKGQSWAFWLLCLYFFFEYVRPQAIWPFIDVLPWSQTVLLASAAAAVVEGKFRLDVPLAGLLSAFTLVVIVSVAGAYDPAASFGRWQLFVNWFLVFFLVVNVVDTKERFFIFVLLYLLWNFKMSQHGARSWAAAGFGFRDWGVVGAPGWFHNSGEFGIQMTMFLPLSVYFAMECWEESEALWKRLFLLAMPVTCLMSVIASSSRGAYLGLAAAAVVMLFQLRQIKPAALITGLLVIGALLIPAEQWDRFETAGEDDTSRARLEYWEDGIEIMNRHPFFGVGYENWLPYYRDHFSGEGHYGTSQVPHNIFIEAGAELGYFGLIAFVLLIFGTFSVNLKTRRVAHRLGPPGEFFVRMGYALDAALVGFLVSGFFVTVLYYPFFWVNLAMTAALHMAVRRQFAETRRSRSATASVRAPRWRRRMAG